MENQYKLVISSRNIFEEVVLPNDAKVFRIGTDKNADFRLIRSLFFEDISLDFNNNAGTWSLMCQDNLYLTIGDSRRLLSKVLSHGDTLSLRYQDSDNEVFSIEFIVDFDTEPHYYERKVGLLNGRISIGSNKDNNIVLNTPYAAGDNIVLSECPEGLKVNIINTTYGVYKNGSKIQDGEIIENMDFLSVGDVSFYYKEKSLWTDISEKCVINGIDSRDYRKKNKYPLFTRNSRIKYTIPDEDIKLLVAPAKPKKPDQNIALTLLPALAMLALTIVVRGFMSNSSNNSFIIFTVCSMTMGIITSIATFISAKNKYKRDTTERVKQYSDYIAAKKDEIEKAREEEKKLLEKNYHDTNTSIQNVKEFSLNLFDRVPEDEDFLKIYLGRGSVDARRKLEYKNREAFETDDELLKIPDDIKREYRVIPGAPITVDFKENSAIGVIGDTGETEKLFRIMLLDIISRHYFSDVELFLLTDDAFGSKWIKKIPHISNGNIRNIVFDGESRNIIFESLYKELTIRSSLKSCEGLSYLVIMVKNEWGIKTHPLSQFISNAKALKAIFVFFGETKESTPLYCGQIVNVTKENTAVLIDTQKGEEKLEFSYEEITDSDMDSVAGILEPVYCDEISLESSLRKSISLFELLGIYSVSDLDLLQNWDNSRVWDSMAAPIGINSKNEAVNLNLHEKFHGPHGLVAGTTGSGKSEILQTYILSAAVLFHPYEISFMIIDFKGGGMVNQFKDLPHLVGAITNIDGREIDRSLMSIKAELLKRQSLFAKANVNHIDKYIKLYKSGSVEVPLPHLVIIVDEFAELKAEQPEFMKELISAARIGRSLGVHLILATQKPSGQVNEQIWSNSRFKLCLKVQTKEDSNEVLKSPLASEIKEPGRAYLQVGNNEIFELLQSGFSGASEKEINANEKSYNISEVSFSGKKRVVFEKKRENKDEDQRTQLEALVLYIKEFCETKRIKKLPSICLPPLSDLININVGKEIAGQISVGIYDNPSLQYQGEVALNIANENTLIIGSSGTGKTNLLQVIIRRITENYTPKSANIYIVDFGTMYLKNFENLCFVGGVVTLSEEEKFKNLIKLLMEEISRRKERFLEVGLSSYSSYAESGFDDIPRIFFIMDNFAVFKEAYGDDFEEELVFILREGLACGISTIITNPQTSGITHKYMSNFAGKVAFTCNDSMEYSSIFDRCRMVPKDVPGRALLMVDKEIFEAQTFLAFCGEREIDRSKAVREFAVQVNSANIGMSAKKIPEIPENLSLNYLNDNYRISPERYSYPIALDYSTVDVVNINFEKNNEWGIIGNEAGKRINVLKSILQTVEYYAIERPVNLFIIDDVQRSLKSFKEKIYTENYTMDYMQSGEIIDSLTEILEERYQSLISEDTDKGYKSFQLMVINNKDAIEHICEDKAILEKYQSLVKKYKALGVGFIYSCLEDAAVPYQAGEIMKRLKDNKTVFVTTSKLKEHKFCEVQSNIARTMKPLESGDAYMLNGSEISRIKYLEVE